MMRFGTLDRYVIREFTSYLTMSLLLFVGLFVIIDLFEKLDTFVDGRAAVMDVVLFYAYGIPFIVVLVVPIAMLLASLLALGQIQKAGELTAMLTSGRSYVRVLMPILALAVAVSIAAYGVAELMMPGASLARERILTEKIRDQSDAPRMRQRHVTYMGRGDRLFYVKTIDAGRNVLRDVVTQRFDAERRVVERFDAREATIENGAWHLRGGFARSGSGDSERVAPFAEFITSEIPETIEDLLRVEPEPESMSRASLAQYIERLRESGARTRKYEVEFHLKLAIPLVNLIIVLLGTGLVLRLRRSGFAIGFGLSIFIGFAYIAFVRAGQAMGYNGVLAPPIAAWLGNAVFLAMAVAIQARANR
jgi:lipopolysaccharide export system permease protein